MQVFKPIALGISTRCVEYRKRLGMCVSVYLYFPFAEAGQPQTLWTEPGMWTFLMQEMSEPVIDVGVVKTRAEFLVHGKVYAPGGQAKACAARARLGNQDKTLLAFGDREWRDGRATEPQPFRELPLDWRHAYGGADFPANPLGKGRAVQDADGFKQQPLPNFEHPDQRLLRPDSIATPVGLGPLDPMWPQRMQYVGTYDDAWLKEHSPAVAPDLQWKYFNIAPQDQWFEGMLRGDEEFEFENLHPQRPHQAGQLPGFRARAFCHRAGAQPGALEEIKLSLTTAWMFPHRERGVLIFQGMHPITDEDGADVHTLMIAAERLGEDKGAEHYQSMFALRMDPQKGGLYLLRDRDLLPDGISGSDPDFDAIQDEYKTRGLMAEAQIRNAELQVQLVRAKLQRMGHDPDALGVRMPAREKTPTLDELPEYFEKKAPEIRAEQKKMLDEAAAQVLKVEAMGVNPLALQHRGPPDYDAAAHLQRLAAQFPPGTPGPDGKPLIDYAMLGPKLAQAEAASRLSYLFAAHEQPPALPLKPERAPALRARIQAEYREGKSFRGRNLTGADLSGLDLRGADFTGAQLESVNFSGANLTRANFTHAVLAHATLTDLVAARATFTGANLGRAKLAGAMLDKSNLSSAILNGTEFGNATLRCAQLAGASILEAKFGPGDWFGAQLAGVLFMKLDLKGVGLACANFKEANFIECDLCDTDLRQAAFGGANFMTCKAVQADFSQAFLCQTIFATGCDLSGANFAGASMERCNFRGTTLAGASFFGAQMDGSDFSEADMQGCDLSTASARSALFIKTRLQGARAHGLNWMETLAQRADLRGADLRGSNFYAADFSRAHLDAATRLNGSEMARARTYPRRAAPPLPPGPGTES